MSQLKFCLKLLYCYIVVVLHHVWHALVTTVSPHHTVVWWGLKCGQYSEYDIFGTLISALYSFLKCPKIPKASYLLFVQHHFVFHAHLSKVWRSELRCAGHTDWNLGKVPGVIKYACMPILCAECIRRSPNVLAVCQHVFWDIYVLVWFWGLTYGNITICATFSNLLVWT